MNLELRIALERLVYLQQIRAVVLEAFGAKPNHRLRLRNSEVTRHVAGRLGAEPSPALGRDVYQAMKAHGWKPVKHSTLYFWKGVGRR